MMENRVEITEVENGYTVRVWKKDENMKDDYGYCEPETYVAADLDEAMTIVKKEF